MFIVAHKRIFFTITTILLVAAISAVSIFGLPLSIDFTGGTLAEVVYEGERPKSDTITSHLQEQGYESFSIRESGESGYIVRTKPLTEEKRSELTQTLTLGGAAPHTVERFSSVGPSIGNELQSKAFISLSIAITIIVLFVAFAFRHVSRPVSSWMYGAIAIAALIFDVLIPVGMFSVLGVTLGAEVDALFVMALLAILGYSVNDTIVVFDRIRENLRRNQEANRREDFELTVGKSLDQMFARSINTSFTSALVLLALFSFGATSTEHFALTLLTGVVVGTYSSLAFAAPTLVVFEKWRRQKQE